MTTAALGGWSKLLRTTVAGSLIAATGALSAQMVLPTGGAAASTPKSAGTLTFGEAVGITSLDPVHVLGGGTSGGNEAGAVYGYLMRYDLATNKFVPYLAKSLTPNKSFTTWTLDLRPGMTFSDGTPFDAQAVVENIERDEATPSIAKTNLALVSSAVPTSPTTVTFTLAQPWSGFGYTLASVPGLVAAPSYLAEVKAGNANATPIGAGPFEVQSFQPGTSLTLVPNPRYALAKPKLSTLKFTNIPGGPSTLQAFQAGQLNAALLIDAPSVQQAKQAGIPALVTQTDLGNELLMNNRSTSPLSNLKLREAITLAINPKVMDERLTQGIPIDSNLLFPKGSVWYSPNEPRIPYNPKRAAELVKEVKQETGWNGTLHLVFPNTASNVPVVLASMLQPVGITLDVDANLPLNTEEIDVYLKHDFDLAAGGVAAPDQQPFMGLWSNFSGSNVEGYSNAQMTAAIDALGAASSSAAQRTAMHRFVSTFLSTYPVVSTGIGLWRTIHKPNVHGLYQSLGGTTLFDKAFVS